MSKEQIIVTVGLNGEIELSAEGMKGKDCHEKTKFLEEALGLDTSKRKNKPEFFQQETTTVKQRT